MLLFHYLAACGPTYPPPLHGRTTTLQVRDISTSPAGACSGTHFLSRFFPNGGGGEEDSLHQWQSSMAQGGDSKIHAKCFWFV